MSDQSNRGCTDQSTFKLQNKQKQIQQFKKNNKKISLHSIYQNDFYKKNKKQYTRQKKYSNPDLSSGALSYIDLQSTYLNQFHNKKLQTKLYHPEDCITRPDKHFPINTTYLKSYRSNQTIDVEKPIKNIQVTLGALPFNAKSNYNKSYNPHEKIKVPLPFIHKDSSSKVSKIGQFQTTNMKSFKSNNNPQLSRAEIIKPNNNLGNLSPFAETTYKNMFLNVEKSKSKKYDIDDIGNINKNRRGKKNL